MTRRTKAFVILATVGLVSSLAACTGSEGGAGQPCRTDAPRCDVGLTCIADRCAVPSDDVTDVTDAIDTIEEFAPDASDVVDARDAADAIDATDASDGSDAQDTMIPDAPICPMPANDAATCFGRGVVDYSLGATICGAAHGDNAVTSASCQPTTGGPEAIYVFDVAATTGVSLSVRASFDSVLSLRAACDDSADLACNDNVPGSTATSSIRTVLPAGRYFAIVDQYGAGGSGGSFTLESSTFAAADNAHCTSAASIASGASLTAEPIATGDASSTVCRTIDRGAERFYTLSVGAGQTLTSVATMHGTWRIAMHLADGCDISANCLADALATTSTSNPTLTWTNHASSTRTVTLAIASVAEPVTDADTYDLTVTLAP